MKLWKVVVAVLGFALIEIGVWFGGKFIGEKVADWLTADMA